MQHSIPYTPQQNGVVERKNKSLKDMATCMLESKSLKVARSVISRRVKSIKSERIM